MHLSSKKVFLLASVIFFGFFNFSLAAEEPRVFITWEADTYTPHDYPGRKMPTVLSRVNASVFAVKDGMLADLSKETVYWYLNGKYYSGGVGVRRIVIGGPEKPGDIFSLRAEIPGLSGALKTIEIPFEQPVVAFETKNISNIFNKSPIRVNMRPLFFNVNRKENLDISWSVNGKSVQNITNPFSLELSVDSPSAGESTEIYLSVIARNKLVDFEGARKNTSLTLSL